MSTLGQLLVVNRRTFEVDFRPQRRYCLLSIRRPGSRFAHCNSEWATHSRLDLMLHEWECDQKPAVAPPVVFQARQAIKVAEWLQRNIRAFHTGEIDLVIQSEHPSPQRSAIRNVIATAFQWSTRDERNMKPHTDTQILLEMAMESLDFSVASCAVATSEPSRVSLAAKFGWIGQIFQDFNVQLVVWDDEGPFDVEHESTAKLAARKLMDRFEVDQTSVDARRLLEVIAGILLLRRTRFSPRIPTAKPQVTREKNGVDSALILDGASLTKAIPLALHFDSVHCHYQYDQPDIGMKAQLLRHGGWLIDSPAEGGRLLSVSWRAEVLNEILHHRLRHPPKTMKE